MPPRLNSCRQIGRRRNQDGRARPRRDDARSWRRATSFDQETSLTTRVRSSRSTTTGRTRRGSGRRCDRRWQAAHPRECGVRAQPSSVRKRSHALDDSRVCRKAGQLQQPLRYTQRLLINSVKVTASIYKPLVHARRQNLDAARRPFGGPRSPRCRTRPAPSPTLPQDSAHAQAKRFRQLSELAKAVRCLDHTSLGQKACSVWRI